jgi:hypothetical protein
VKVLISGASGLIGTALIAQLEREGHRVVRLVRPLSRSHPGGAPSTSRNDSEATWDPDSGSIDASRLQNTDAVVNLAGASIARWPWTSAHKRRVLESRVRSTSLLARTVAALPRKPRVFVSASGVGYYGDRGDEVLRETSAGGRGFLAEVCRAWESAAAPASDAGIRLATLRVGMVLSNTGGALPVMARPFRLGLGGVLGNGRQYMSWIAIEDLVRAIAHAIDHEDLSGPVNAVSPAPVTNAEFTVALGRVLHRPTPFPVPAFALRALLGEMADELLLSSQRVEPARLQASGFSYRHPNLEEALRAVLA